MKKIIFAGLAITLTISAFSQEQELSRKEQRKIQKELKKEQQAEMATKRAVEVGLMVEYGRFVLEANKLRDKRGNTVDVPAMLNFIATDSTTGVIQIGSYQYVGLNGVGGLTIEGPLVRLSKDWS